MASGSAVMMALPMRDCGKMILVSDLGVVMGYLASGCDVMKEWQRQISSHCGEMMELVHSLYVSLH